MTIEEIIDELKSPHTSWAIWDNDFGNQEFDSKKFQALLFEKKDSLKPHIIFIGLNPSKKIKENFLNFHSPTHRNDRKLKQLIQDQESSRNLQGALMTDLVLNNYSPTSSTVQVNEKDFDELRILLEKLNQKKYHIICFGNKVFDAMKKIILCEKKENNLVSATNMGFPHSIQLYKMTHYSAAVKNSLLTKQLAEINKKVEQ